MLQAEFVKLDHFRLGITCIKPIVANGAYASIKEAEDSDIIAGDVGYGLIFGIKERRDRGDITPARLLLTEKELR